MRQGPRASGRAGISTIESCLKRSIPCTAATRTGGEVGQENHQSLKTIPASASKEVAFKREKKGGGFSSNPNSLLLLSSHGPSQPVRDKVAGGWFGHSGPGDAVHPTGYGGWFLPGKGVCHRFVYNTQQCGNRINLDTISLTQTPPGHSRRPAGRGGHDRQLRHEQGRTV